MAIKRGILGKFRRRNLTDTCENCVTCTYLTANSFIGIPIRGKCTHDNRIKSEFSVSILSIIASILSGVILLVGSVYELNSSYDSRIRFWDLQNMKALGLSLMRFVQGLIVLLRAAYCRAMKSTMTATQYCIYQFEFIADKSEILKILLNVQYVGEICTVISIFFMAIFSAYHSWILSKFTVITMLDVYAFTQISLGFTFFVIIHHLLLQKCYEKLRNVLASLANDIETELKLIMEVRAISYRTVSKFIDSARLLLYLHIVGCLFSHSEILCVVILRLFNGDFFILKDEYTFFATLCIINYSVNSFACYTSEKLAKEVRFFVYTEVLCGIKSYIFRRS